METTITATELARNLSDVLNRVRYKHERFVVVRNGVRVAEVRPPASPSIKPLSEVLAQIGHLHMPGDGFADDLEEIQANQPLAEFREWPT